jgi:aryl-alcohol dehydrogenase-like predicted oxidoreductase
VLRFFSWLVGSRNAAEVTENLGALGWSISAADMTEIDVIIAGYDCVNTPTG